MAYKKLFSDTIITSISQVVSMVTPLIILAFTSRIYSTEIFYANLITLSIMGFFSVLNDAGLYQYYVKCFSEERDHKNKLNWLFTVAYGQKILTCLLCVLIIFLLTFFENYSEIVYFLLIGLIGSIFQALHPIWYYNGMDKMSSYAIANISAKFFGLFLLYVLINFFETNFIPVICFTFSNMILALYFFFDIRRGQIRLSIIKFSDVINIFSVARMYFFSRTLSTISTYLIVIVLGVSAFSLAGVFAIADQIYKAIKLSASPMVQVIIPYCIRTKNSKPLLILTTGISFIGLILYSYIDLVLIDFVNLIWGSLPEGGKDIVFIYAYAGILSMINALLGFPWFAIIGFYDRANSSLIWATLVSLTLLAYAFYYDQSFLAYIVFTSELALLIFRLLHLGWLRYKIRIPAKK